MLNQDIEAAVQSFSIAKESRSFRRVEADFRVSVSSAQALRHSLGDKWIKAPTWMLPKGAAEADIIAVRTASDLVREKERTFYYNFLTSQYGVSFKGLFLFSALHSPEIYFDYRKPFSRSPIGNWDYADYAFTASSCPRIKPDLVEHFTRQNVGGAEHIPAWFQFGDTGWNEADLPRYASWLSAANCTTRLIGWAISHNNTPTIPALVKAGEYDVVYYSAPYAGDVTHELVATLCRPGGIIITEPSSYRRGLNTIPKLELLVPGCVDLKFVMLRKEGPELQLKKYP